MDDIILCGLSAFRYYRTPPQALALYPALIWPKGRHNAFVNQPLSADILGEPIFVLATSRMKRTGAQSVKQCYWEGELPQGHIRKTDCGFSIVSPEMALFQLASRVSVVHLAMAMMESIGWFSVLRLSETVKVELASADACRLNSFQSWRQPVARNGAMSDLWMRRPITSIAALRSFWASVRGRRGSMKFFKALNMLTGETASPFEVQASLLLSMPRKCGGEGLSCFQNNAEIRLSKEAKLVSGLSKCYVDLLFPSDRKGRSVAIECQGRIAHGKSGMSVGDANRMLALQIMGIDVIPLTYEQIADEDRFRAVVETLVDKMGRPYSPKTASLLEAQRILRNRLFINWRDLGEAAPGVPI